MLLTLRQTVHTKSSHSPSDHKQQPCRRKRRCAAWPVMALFVRAYLLHLLLVRVFPDTRASYYCCCKFVDCLSDIMLWPAEVFFFAVLPEKKKKKRLDRGPRQAIRLGYRLGYVTYGSTHRASYVTRRRRTVLRNNNNNNNNNNGENVQNHHLPAEKMHVYCK
jgi:hypothetical protein